MQRSRERSRGRLPLACTALLLLLLPACGEPSKFANLPSGMQKVAEHCDRYGDVIIDNGAIVELNLSGDKVTDVTLARIKEVDTLKKLYLVNAQITDEGIADLASLPALEVLDISGCQGVTAASAEHIKKMSKLRDFLFRGCAAFDLAVRTDLKKHFENQRKHLENPADRHFGVTGP